MFSSLRSRLLAASILILVVILLAAGITLGVASQKAQDVVARSRLESILPVTTRLVRELWTQGMSAEEIAAELTPSVPAERARIVLMTPLGLVLGDTAQGELVGQRLNLPPLARLRQNPQPTRSGQLQTPSGQTYYFALSILPPPNAGERTRPRPEPLIVAQIVRQRPFQGLAELSRPLVWAAGIALLLGVVLAWLISRSVSRPLLQIAAATEQVAQGDLDLDLAVQGPREVVALAGQFERMAAEVKASRQAQRDFIANVSHDLKTPLTAIRGFSQAIVEGVAEDPARTQRAAQIIHDESLRMERLVAQLLDLARLDAGQAQLHPVRLDVRALLAGVVERMTLPAQQKGVELSTEAGDSLWIEGDGDRLMQVFVNLVDNAIRHTPAGGTVTCAARLAANAVEITVQDSGPGIAPDELPHVFERFYQADTARGGGKAGLGLAIVQEIVQAHGGETGVESPPGSGARFWVRLPLA